MSQPMYRIPLSRCCTVGQEAEFLEEVLASGRWGGGGTASGACEAVLRDEFAAPGVLLTSSGTAALNMMAPVLGLDAAGEVILPSYTFVSTANAFAAAGMRVLFCDIESGTLNLDPAHAAALAGPRTRAVVAMHYAGVACHLDVLDRTARASGALLLEDNAHGLAAKYRERPLGSFGTLAALSFDHAKNLTCGEGGALVINDPQYLAAAEEYLEKGTNRRAYLRGQAQGYEWRSVGSHCTPSELASALLLAQLRARASVQARREQQWRYYFESLATWAVCAGAQLPVVPLECESSYHIFFVVFPDAESHRLAHQRLTERGIQAAPHFPLLHLSPQGRAMGGREGQCPVAEALCPRLLRLPLFHTLMSAEQDEVIEVLTGSYP